MLSLEFIKDLQRFLEENYIESFPETMAAETCIEYPEAENCIEYSAAAKKAKGPETLGLVFRRVSKAAKSGAEEPSESDADGLLASGAEEHSESCAGGLSASCADGLSESGTGELFGSFPAANFLPSEAAEEDLRERLAHMDAGFGEMLISKIDSLGMSDSECYHRAQLNRSHFNKIKNDPNYHVQKETVFALILALGLSRREAGEFLAKAGYAFSPSSKADLIVEFCISRGLYDVTEVNQLLYEYDQKLLGAGVRD